MQSTTILQLLFSTFSINVRRVRSAGHDNIQWGALDFCLYFAYKFHDRFLSC